MLKSKAHLRILQVFFILLTAFGLFISISFLTINQEEYTVTTIEETEASGTISGFNDTNKIIEFSDLLILDKYATYGDDDENKERDYIFYLVSFQAPSGNEYFASLRCKPKDSIYTALKAYTSDDEKAVGDMSIHTCAKIAPSSSSYAAQLSELYSNAVHQYNSVLNHSVTDSGLMLEYAFDTADQLDDYNANQRNNDNAYVIFFFIVAAVGIIGIVLTTLKIKKNKKVLINEIPQPNTNFYQK
ncbi:MAG: hypothetical protein NC397_05520 [Clostridium sp.]|nr:hypothetical protein [Clostridium sp.]